MNIKDNEVKKDKLNLTLSFLTYVHTLITLQHAKMLRNEDPKHIFFFNRAVLICTSYVQLPLFFS
jgi:hypothetical protein